MTLSLLIVSSRSAEVPLRQRCWFNPGKLNQHRPAEFSLPGALDCATCLLLYAVGYSFESTSANVFSVAI